jgi:NAD+ kinase
MKTAYIFTTKERDIFYHQVVSALDFYGVKAVDTLPKNFAEMPQFSLVLGGDGAVLAAGRAGAPNPIMVVNRGHLGFLTSTDEANYLEALKRFLEGRYTLTKRRTLRVQVAAFRPTKEPDVYNAVNEVVIAKNQLSKLVKVRVHVYYDKNNVAAGKEVLGEYRADGLIVSTPTGSTAYNVSAGGSIIHPLCDVLSITPICPQGLTQRPLIIPATMKVQLEPLEEELFVSVDGQDGCPMRGYVDVSYNDHHLEIVNPTDTYFQILRKKLAWGVNPV